MIQKYYRKLKLLMVLTLCVCSHTGAQLLTGLNKDSLKTLVQSLPEDSIKVLQLITLGQQYESNQPDSAVNYYEQARQLSERIHYPAGFVKYVNNYTAVLNVQGRFDESLRLHQKALQTEDQNGLTIYRLKTLINIGVVYQLQDNYQVAADHYLQNLSVFESSGDQQSLALLYSNLSALYRNLNNSERSLYFGKKGLAIAERSGDLFTVGMISDNMANVLKGMGKLKEAGIYLEKAYSIGLELDNIDLQQTALIAKADILSKTSDPDIYIPVFEQVLPLADSIGDVLARATAENGICRGLYMKKDYPAAAKRTEEALSFTAIHELKELHTHLLLLMSDIQIGLGNLRLAEQYRGSYDSAYAGLISKQLLQNVQELETKYEVEKKQSRILRQNLLLTQKEREVWQQRWWLVFLCIAFLLAGAILFFVWRTNRQRQLLQRKTIENLHAEQENIRLKSLLDGQLQERQRISQEMHDDMGSGLTSLLYLARSIQGQDAVAGKISDTSQGLIRQMNEIIWTMNQEQDTLESLLTYLRKNVAESLDNAGIQISFQLPEPVPEKHLPQEVRRHLYLCVKEAVHNIIRHADADAVSLNIETDTEILVVISDNGKGFGQKNYRRFGNGLKNMKKRMEAVGGSFQFSTGQSGTTITLQAPL